MPVPLEKKKKTKKAVVTKSSSSGSVTKADSSSTTIKVLVCTANLGNAKPGAADWDAWIPKDGKLFPPSIPVRMAPPQRRPGGGRNSSSDSGSGSGGTVLTGNNNNNNTSNPRQRRQRSSENPQAFSLQRKQAMMPVVQQGRPSLERNLSDPKLLEKKLSIQQVQSEEEEYETWLQEQQHQSSKEEEDEYEKFLREQQQAAQAVDDDDDQEYEVFLKDDDDDTEAAANVAFHSSTPNFVTAPSCTSSDDSLASKSLLDSNHFPAFSDEESANAGSVDSSEEFNWVPKQSLPEKDFSKVSQVQPQRKSLLAPKGPSTAIPVKKTSSESVTSKSSQPRRNSSGESFLTAAANINTNDHFDIIVIGMQEATFEIKEKSKSKTMKAKKKASDGRMPKSLTKKGKRRQYSGGNNNIKTIDEMQKLNDSVVQNNHRLSSSFSSMQSASSSEGEDGFESSDDDDDSIASLSSSDGEEENFVCWHDDGTVSVVDSSARLIKNSQNEYVLEESAKYKRKTTSKGLKKLLATGTQNAGKKIVKVGFQAGKFGIKGMGKVGKAGLETAVKTAKTADTYAGGIKDHSKRPVPSTMHISSNATVDGDAGGWTDTDTLHYRLETEQIPGYQRTCSFQLGEMRLMVYVRLAASEGKEATIKSIEVESVKYQATGIGGVLANKGGVLAEILVNKSTRLSFWSSHLEAHEGEHHFAARCTSLQDIAIGGGHKYYDATQSSHYSFVMGDLNFRTKLAGVSDPKRQLQMAHDMAAKKKWFLLNEYDELREALLTKKCLTGFETPYCGFQPTFKVSRKAGYDYNPKRSPSFTDRILFKSADQLDPLIPFVYEPVDEFASSDHKPIRGAFEVPLNPSLRWKPAAPIKGAAEAPKKSSKKLKPGPDKKGKRELLHFFVSDIKSAVSPNDYDKLKKVEKADVPSPILLFVTNPNSAIHKDDGTSKKKIWNKLGFASNGGKASKRPSDAPNASSSKYPATSIQKDTLRPNWNDESVHFSVSTHKPSGEAISLGSALLHFCLRDSKTATVIGSYVMNLAHLMAITRKPAVEKASVGGAAAMLRRGSTDDAIGGMGGSSANNTTNSINKQPMTKRRGSSDGFSFQEGPSNALLQASVTGKSQNEHVQRASLTLNPTQLNNNSNFLLNRHAAAGQTFGESLTTHAGNIGRPKSRRNNNNRRHQLTRGPSKSLVTAIVKDRGNSSKSTAQELQKMNLFSLRLENEPLIGGGLEVGKLSCNIDVWWTPEEEE